MQLLDGKALSEKILEEIKQKVASFKSRPPHIVVVIVGQNPASHLYVSKKTKMCQQVGIKSTLLHFDSSISQQNLIDTLEKLNQDRLVDAILVQMPLPAHISETKVMQTIDPRKDVDGFHPTNIGKLLSGDLNTLVPCTPLGVYQLMKHYQIETKGKNLLVIGRSNIVGKPTAALFMQNRAHANATVTVAHSQTKDLTAKCQEADIIICALGKANFLQGPMIKAGAVLIDVGINKIEDKSKKSGFRLVGDICFESVKNKCSYLTPVPGGVGPMTIAMLMSNTLDCFTRNNP